METIYKKMYALVVGGADDAATFLEDCLRHGRCCPETCNRAIQMLTDALMKAEELYLDAEEE